MQGMIKKAIMWVIGILVLYAVLAGTLGSIITANTTLKNVSNLPTIIGTISDFWWVGVIIMLIGVVVSTGPGKSMVRRFRGRRR